MRLTLKAVTPWEKELAKRIRRGVKLLDSVTPGWFLPINPGTLKVSNRESCVFAQANHSFKEGIVQVAKKALAEGKKVELLKNDLRRYHWLPSTKLVPHLDVFYYGFDVSWEDATEFLGPRDKWDTRGSRKEAFKTIDRFWHSVVVQKKKDHAAVVARQEKATAEGLFVDFPVQAKQAPQPSVAEQLAPGMKSAEKLTQQLNKAVLGKKRCADFPGQKPTGSLLRKAVKVW